MRTPHGILIVLTVYAPDICPVSYSLLSSDELIK
jgi:hypothetical protein